MHYPLLTAFSYFFYFITLGPLTEGFVHDADRVLVGISYFGTMVTSFVAVWAWTACQPVTVLGYDVVTATVVTLGAILNILHVAYRNPSVDSYKLRPVKVLLADYCAAMRVRQHPQPLTHLSDGAQSAGSNACKHLWTHGAMFVACRFLATPAPH